MVLTALISVAFMMRNTSPIGWIPLLAVKVLNEGSLLPFIKSAIVIALPILAGLVYIDTLYYNTVGGGNDKFVITGYNFFIVNV